MTKKSKFPFWLFAIVFVIASLLPLINRRLSSNKATLIIPNNSGSSNLISYDSALIAVFSNGSLAAWNWTSPAQPLWQYAAKTDCVVVLDDNRVAGVTKAGRKILFIADAKQGKILFENPVGYEDQECWLLQSPDNKTVVLVRNNPDKDGVTLYEFMSVDTLQNSPGMPISLDIPTKEKRFIAFAVSNDKKIIAAGSSGKKGYLSWIDLDQGKVILKKEYEQAAEFTSAAFTPDGTLAYLTNRNGSVYGIQTAEGELKDTFTVLKAGQKNPVTNETTSKNVTISANGQYVAAEVINNVHVWEIPTGRHIYQCSPGHKLTGAIALSADGSLLATSDIRAGGSVKIWQIKKQ